MTSYTAEKLLKDINLAFAAGIPVVVKLFAENNFVYCPVTRLDEKSIYSEEKKIDFSSIDRSQVLFVTYNTNPCYATLKEAGVVA